jgi:hypothetical protein
MVYIYVLKLENNKYYIGKTNNPEIRIDQHQGGFGAYWTKKYPVKETINIIPDCDSLDEDKYTIKYMGKYGIDNVRGGSFCKIELQKAEIDVIKQMIRGNKDICFICGSKNHFARDCNNRPCDCVSSYFSPHRKRKCLLRKIDDFIEHDRCRRCGRKGHTSMDCYAKTNIEGEELLPNLTKINNIKSLFDKS